VGPRSAESRYINQKSSVDHPNKKQEEKWHYFDFIHSSATKRATTTTINDGTIIMTEKLQLTLYASGLKNVAGAFKVSQ
jgi:hypothetical protein